MYIAKTRQRFGGSSYTVNDRERILPFSEDN